VTEYRSAPLTRAAMNATRITITPFLSKLPADIIGGSKKMDRAARSLTLRFGSLSTEADLPTDSRTGKPRTFLRDRGEFTRHVIDAASVGDCVIFEQTGPYEFRLHVEKPDGVRIYGSRSGKTEQERIRQWALRETRPDQQRFRREVAERDGLKCAITGCEIEEILDAAHLAKRAPGGSDDPSNGMILRADIHRLFDTGLVRIDPTTRTVVVEDRIADTDYRNISGQAVQSAADLSNLPPASVNAA